MPRLALSHLEMALLFALCTSIVLGLITVRPTGPDPDGVKRVSDRERIMYGLKSFGYFMLAIFGLGWGMYFLHG